jgi:16S rRNA (cytidine1402-2'-O)-methyltransferase
MSDPGILYIVATPIGNLDDISQRALKILQAVDVIAAEDTRHSKKLLQAYQINTPLLSLHEHNENARTTLLLDRVLAGEQVALISDAGTPLISDPGYVLVKQARERNVSVVPVPGACAAVAALSASGLPTDQFLFAGFLPQKAGPRKQALEAALSEPGTLVFYESPRRILDFLELMQSLAPEHTLCLAKELTKTFERFFTGVAADLLRELRAQAELQKGEWVVMVAPAPKTRVEGVTPKVLAAVELAARDMPLKRACELVASLTEYKKNQLYQAVLDSRDD